jgi:hypothetical protein
MINAQRSAREIVTSEGYIPVFPTVELGGTCADLALENRSGDAQAIHVEEAGIPTELRDS